MTATPDTVHRHDGDDRQQSLRSGHRLQASVHEGKRPSLLVISALDFMRPAHRDPSGAAPASPRPWVCRLRHVSVGCLQRPPIDCRGTPRLQGVAELIDHSWTLTSDRCTFDTGRLRPGVLFTEIRGHDAGQFGDRSFEAVEREYARFLLPVTWFIDARGSEGVSGGVLEQWTRWLGATPACLDSLHVLAPARHPIPIAAARPPANCSRRHVLIGTHRR